MRPYLLMKMYQDNGYVNFNYMYDKSERTPFNFGWGGRGTGKTYNAIQGLINLHKPFIYMRRQQSQSDLILDPELCPFKTPLRDMGYEYKIDRMAKNIYGVFGHAADEEESRLLAISLSLSTVAGVRGFDASNIDCMLYDEFIPEAHARPIKNEASAFLNCYETVNRNRELNGRKPLKVFAFSNSDNAVCPIFVYWELLETVIGMSDRRAPYLMIPERGISLYNYCDSPISKRKAETALYKAAGANSAFTAMAINNEFVDLNRGNIKSMDLKNLYAMVNVGELCIYRTRDKRSFYISRTHLKTKNNYGADDIDLQRFRASYSFLWIDYLHYNVYSENLICEKIFLTYMKKAY